MWKWPSSLNWMSLGTQEVGREGKRSSSGEERRGMAVHRSSFCMGGRMMEGRGEEMEETSSFFFFTEVSNVKHTFRRSWRSYCGLGVASPGAGALLE